MSDTAIRVEGLGKEYRIGALQNQNTTFREVLSSTLKAPLRRARAIFSGQAYGAAGLDESVWALKDINFEVKQGEVVGIIGHNGAGKSTLLKVLSRITEPSEGYADIYGRIGALLEVGTGFHLELTGRENVYLNGSILGMSRQEVASKFDEIVDFAGVERFIDTPVKHYSSGMRLRLGFAVAAHLEPEILVVDEVLAVGDAAFQQKSLGKMQNVAQEGRTVLFVSHNMAAMASLTTRAFMLEQGRMVYSGETSDVINHYLATQIEKRDDSSTIDLTVANRAKRFSETPIRFTGLRLTTEEGMATNQFMEGQPIIVEVSFRAYQRIEGVQWGLGVGVLMEKGELFTIPSHVEPVLEEGQYTTRLKIDPNYLASGNYEVVLKLFANGGKQDQIDHVTQINISYPVEGYDNLAHTKNWVSGYMRFNHQWESATNAEAQQSVLESISVKADKENIGG